MVQGNLQQQYNDLHAQAMEAIEHWDAYPAWNEYRELEKFLAALPSDQTQDPGMVKEVETLKRKLLVVGFPALPSDEAVKLFRGHILDFFRVDVDFKERLLTRYTFVGYGEKDEERQRLREAILQNSERLGPFTLGEWMKLFDQRFKMETREKTAALEFLTQTSEVASLGKVEQSILGRILVVYDENICREVLDEIDVAVLSEKANVSQSSFRTMQKMPVSNQKNIALPLLQALSKYENLGNQLITGERIRVKSQTEPVRPSLLYWLKYYRDELGIGQHSSVERGDFLFRSENGRKLSPEERERVNLILKSVEEEFPLSIDTERQEIIFPASNAFSVTSAGEPAFQGVVMEKRGMPLPPMAPPAMPRNEFVPSRASSTGVGTPAFFVPKPEESESRQRVFETAPERPDMHRGQSYGESKDVRNSSFGESGRMASIHPSNVSFSASHIFPVEKEAAQNQGTSPMATRPSPSIAPRPAPVPPSPRPMAKPAQNDSPYRIHPVSMEEKD